jgi:hypothetical protein
MKVFIDCGTHLGDGGSAIINKFGIDDKWQIYSFEANPNTFNYLTQCKLINKSSKFAWLNWKNTNLINKAVWIEDGEVDFSPSELIITQDLLNNIEFKDFLLAHDQMVNEGVLIAPHQNTGLPVDGSSTIFFDQQSRFLKKFGNPGQKQIKFNTPIKVSSIDFSNFLFEFQESEKLVIKLDVEGSEFKILLKCIQNGTAKYINTIFIEWHDAGKIRLKILKRLIIFRLRILGVEVLDWV